MGLFCVSHKTPDMIDVISKTCEVDGCEMRPTYNFHGEKKGRFCSIHKTPDMIDVMNKTCEVDGCEIQSIYNLPGEKKGSECEQTRMVNLVHARVMPVKWIRYNPDMYQPINRQQMWTRERREKKLMEYIHYAMKHTPQEDNGCISHVLYLFYDDYDTTKQEWLKLI